MAAAVAAIILVASASIFLCVAVYLFSGIAIRRASACHRMASGLRRTDRTSGPGHAGNAADLAAKLGSLGAAQLNTEAPAPYRTSVVAGGASPEASAPRHTLSNARHALYTSDPSREISAMLNSAPAAADSQRVAVQAASTPLTGLGTLAVGVITIAALYFGRAVFVPMALAILLSFALGPPVVLLRRWHVNRVFAVIAVVALAFAVIVGIFALIGSQVEKLAENLPQYQTNITEKIHSLRDTTASSGVVRRTMTMLSDLGGEITKPGQKIGRPAANQPGVLAPGADQQKPVPVEIRPSDPTPIQLILRVAGPLLEPLAMAGIVVVFVIFFLLQRQDLRDRFIRLAGARDLRRTTQAMDDAAHRLSRYLLMQSGINASLGALIGTGLWVIGVPNPALWGVLAMLLRFVPYIGPVIAAAFPAALAVAVDPGWSMLLWVIGLFVVAEGIAGQLIEPWLYGQSTGLSGVAIVVAAAFWTLLWGPVGLLLSTPLTMCLVVLGRHVEHFQFLEVLLGDRPPLAPEESFYQRLLADDPDEAAHQAEGFLKNKPLSAYYDEVAIKGLALAQFDVNRGALDHAHRARIKEAIEWVIDDLSDHDDAMASAPQEGVSEVAASPPALSSEELAPGWRETAVLCVAGRGSLDEAAAAMLVQLLKKHGIGARVVPSEAVSVANVMRLDVAGVQMAFLSYLEPGSLTNARYLVRRLRRRLPQATIIDGFWTLTAQEAADRDALLATRADCVVTSLRQAVEQAVAAAKLAASADVVEGEPHQAGVAPLRQPRII
jgi:predicted PurR-regulated permease PerM